MTPYLIALLIGAVIFAAVGWVKARDWGWNRWLSTIVGAAVGAVLSTMMMLTV